MLDVGREVGGYRLDRLRTGGEPLSVFEGTQLSLDRPVDVEVLDLGDSASFSAEVLDEAARYARLDDPGLTPVLDSGSVGELIYRVVPRLDGRVLRTEHLAGPLDPHGALELLEDVAAALDALHDGGLVHRDVRPDTVLLRADGGAQLTPPRLLPPAGHTATVEAFDPGALVYMAPEVLRGSAPDATADRWSLAATAFELFTGQPPFPSPETAISAARGEAGTPLPRAARPELPEGVDTALRQGLATDPARRPETASEFVEALREAWGERPAAPPPSPGWSNRRTIVLASVVVLGAAVVVAGSLLRGNGGPDVPPLLEGAVAIGSSLEGSDDGILFVDCNGEDPSIDSPECTILQTGLPGTLLRATEDGSIRGWTIRGATGTFRLQVLRPRENGHGQVFVGQVRDVPDTGIHHFEENLTIWENDVVSLYVMSGGVGVRPGVAGAETNRWLPHRGGGPATLADRPAGTGFDHELLLRVDYLPGVPAELPEQLDGEAAEAAPDGEILESIDVQISEELLTRIDLVVAEDRLWLDIVVDGNRTSRIEVPDIDLAGELVEFQAETYGDDQRGGAGVDWHNPEDAHPIEHFFQIEGRFWFFIS